MLATFALGGGCQTASPVTDEAARAGGSQELCWNGEDDDGDGAVDCDDTDCGLSDGCEVTWKQVAASKEATCGLTDEGAVWCWGQSGSLQRIGDDSRRFVDLDAGSRATCGVTESGEAWCWGGWNDGGELGRADLGDLDYTRPIYVPIDARIESVSMGRGHGCALDTDAQAWCWGQNNQGQLGISDTSKTAAPPTRVVEDLRFRQLEAGAGFTCGITDDERLLCWGYAPDVWDVPHQNLDRDILPEPRELRQERFQTLSMANLIQLRATHCSKDNHAVCAIDSAQTLHCWQRPPRWARAADDDASAEQEIHRTIALENAADVAVGDRFGCARSVDGEISCWGINGRAQLGRVPDWDADSPKNECLDEPIAIDLPAPASQLSAGGNHSCAVIETGDIWCWGDNTYSQLGGAPQLEFVSIEEEPAIRGLTELDEHKHNQETTILGALARQAQAPDAEAAPTQPEDVLTAVDYHASLGMPCWVTTDGIARCNAAKDAVEKPVRHNDEGEFGRRASVAAGSAHACVIDPEGALWCAGSNLLGSRGTGVAPSPEQAADFERVGGERTFLAVSASEAMTCAVDTDAGLWCWGANRFGQLGGGPGSGSAVPQEIAHDARFVDVSTGFAHVCALDEEGGAWCLGDNRYGQLGDGSIEATSSPVAVAANARFVDVVAGKHHSCALTQDHQVYCWGRNQWGQLGTERPGDRPRPVHVGLDVEVDALAVDDSHSCALNSDATQLWCWGGGTPEPTVRLEKERITSVSTALDHVCVTSGEAMGVCLPLSARAIERGRRKSNLSLGRARGLRPPSEPPSPIALEWFMEDPKAFQEESR